MIYLRNADVFEETATLASPDANAIVRYDRGAMLLPDGQAQGQFADVGGVVLAMFRHEHRLYLFFDGKSVPWEQIQSVSLVRKPDGFSEFSVRLPDTELSLTYSTPVIDPPLDPLLDPFSSIEDFDFCLFIKHVFDNKLRSEGVFQSSGSRRIDGTDPE